MVFKMFSVVQGTFISKWNAPLGYEPEGESCDGSESFSKKDSGTETPNGFKWSKSLQALLNDEDGLGLFREYLKRMHTTHFYKLEFWLACKGLSKQQSKQTHQSVKVIYTHLFLKAQFGDALRDAVTQKIKYAADNNRLLSAAVFHEACHYVEEIMNDEVYPNFLDSDIFLGYLEKMRDGECGVKEYACNGKLMDVICQRTDDESSNFCNEFKPRTADSRLSELTKSKNPEIFANDLIARLEKLNEKKNEEPVSSVSSVDLKKVLASVILEKCEDNSEDILDQHVSRIFEDMIPANKIPHPYSVYGPIAGPKAKDLYSTDSGIATISSEGTDYRNLCKSKPTSSEYGHQIQMTDIAFPGHCQRSNNKLLGWSKKTLIQDSGINSGVNVSSYNYSETSAPQRSCHSATTQRTCHKDRLPASWLTCKRNSAANYAANVETDANNVPYKHKPRCNTALIHAHNYKNKNAAPEKNIANLLPIQPFIADPSMPPFSFHSIDVATQLEEARRRLLKNEIKHKLKYPPWNCRAETTTACCPNVSSKTDVPVQRFSNAGKNGKTYDECLYTTTVVYNFNDEVMPYLLKVPGDPITLRQFKEYLPKKGHYRYFFVTPCEDLEMRPIQEEITDDNQYLPLWKGKVNAQIKAVK